MKAADVETQEDLQAWLEGQRQEVCVWIAARAASRVLPVYWREVPQITHTNEIDLTALLVGNAILTATSFSREADSSTRVSLADAANDFPRSLDGGLSRAADVAAESALDSGLAARLDPAHLHLAQQAAYYSEDAAARAFDAAATAFENLTDDARWAEAESITVARPLWPKGIPVEFANAWQTTRATLTARVEAGETGWQFWLDWYEAQLTGADQNWEMLKEIVLIPDADWQQGAAHVNGLIEEIVGRYRVEDVIADNPYAHRIEFDPARNRLVSLPVDTPDLAGIIDAVGQALADFEDRCARLDANSNIGTAMQSALDLPVADLHSDLKRHHNDAAMLFEKLEAARREIDMIAGQEAFANEGSFKRLTHDLERRAEDILAAAPAVLEMERNRVAVQVARYTEEQRLMALRLCAGMHNDSDGGLQAAAALAVRAILNPDSPEVEKRNAWYFLKAASTRGAKAMSEAGAEPSSRQEAKSYLEQAAQAGGHLAKIDKGVDAIQEMSGEGKDWVLETFTQIASGNFFGLVGSS